MKLGPLSLNDGLKVYILLFHQGVQNISAKMLEN